MSICPHCKGYGQTPYQQPQHHRMDEIEAANAAGDFPRAMLLKMTNNTITAMKCQPCDGTGDLP